MVSHFMFVVFRTAQKSVSVCSSCTWPIRPARQWQRVPMPLKSLANSC